jgi:hypothetical protein
MQIALIRQGNTFKSLFGLALIMIFWPLLFKTYEALKPPALAPGGVDAKAMLVENDLVLAYKIDGTRPYSGKLFYWLYVNDLSADRSTYGFVTFDCDNQHQTMTSIYSYPRANFKGDWRYSLRNIDVAIVNRRASAFAQQLQVWCQS